MGFLLQQRRGKGGPRYKNPKHRQVNQARYRRETNPMRAVITDLIHCPGHSAPLAEIRYEDGVKDYILAAEGVAVDDHITVGAKTKKPGSVSKLSEINEGTPVFNLELRPLDGGKLVRSSGAFATLVGKTKKHAIIRLPSGSTKNVPLDCRATIGIVAGGGRKEKPMLKAGKKHYARMARNKLYPIVRGVAMNPTAHPHGGVQHHVGAGSTVKRNASPGAKVGHLAARRMGRKKR